MSGPRIFIIILILIGVLFAGTIWLGAQHGGSSESADQFVAELTAGKHPLIQGLGGLFAPASPPLSTVSGGCVRLSNRAMTFNHGPCTLRAAAATSRMPGIAPARYRNVKFQVTSGVVSFAPDQLNKQSNGSSLQWQPRQNGSLIIGAENDNSLTLVCLDTTSCQVQFE